MLSRGLAGVRGGTLIVNLPGSPKSIEQIGGELEEPLRHALALIAGERDGHGTHAGAPAAAGPGTP
jgi:molybdopterin biosynthesis enzyme MoaB